MDVAACLADRRRYERQIERLHTRHLTGGGLYRLQADGVPLATLVRNRARVARLLARDVADGSHVLEPGVLRSIRVRGKVREVYSCGLVDLIVHGVVAEIVREATAPTLSPRVFSYRPGSSPATPVAQFAGYVRSTRRAQVDPLRRGVHVLRADVASYTDSIPIGARSPLWAMLAPHVGSPPHPVVADVIRAAMVVDGGVACRVTGLPMGQPIAPVLANLYLGPLDATLEGLAVEPEGFYARYGDDVLFAHPDPGAVVAAEEAAAGVLDELGLRVNGAKRRVVHLNAAGRPQDGAPGAPSVAFLGARISAAGTVGLDDPKVRAVLRAVRRRANATAATLRTESRDGRGRAVCAAVNHALSPRLALGELSSADRLRAIVTDRAQLTALDHRIAQLVASAVTGTPGPRAFREVPYRALRSSWGLRSLVDSRNRVGRAPRRWAA